VGLLIYKMFNNINMNFFNAQFLILIAIIVIVYFLYKEINFIHKKINKIQLLIDEKPKTINLEQSAKIKNKIKELNTLSESSSHIAIYSNDNENSSSSFVSESDNSDHKLTNLPSPKSIVSVNITKSITENVVDNTVTESIIDDTISKSVINEIVPDPVINHIQPESVINDVAPDSVINDIVPESVNENSVLSQTTIDITNILNQELSQSNEINLNNLEKMKLSEIKKIAEQNNITLSRKINGIQKNKNKKELIDNILNKL
jgi:hypothetical protein